MRSRRTDAARAVTSGRAASPEDYLVACGATLTALLVACVPLDLALAERSATASATVSGLAAGVAAGLTLVGRRCRTVRSRCHVAGALGLVAVVDSVVHLHLQQDPVHALYTVLCVVAAGALLTSRPWLLVLQVVALGGTALVARAGDLAPGAGQVRPAPALGVLLVSCLVAQLQQSTRLAAHARVVELTDRLREQALVDDLTGLLNRRGLHDGAARLLRTGRRCDMAAVVVDVDGFKTVNDDLGHLAGDDVLRQVAAGLRESVSDGALVARTGGDEFVLLVPDDGGADRLVERIRERLRHDGDSRWSTSIGLARGAVGDAADLEALVNSADAAMYVDKTVRRGGAPATPARVPTSRTASDVAGPVASHG